MRRFFLRRLTLLLGCVVLVVLGVSVVAAQDTAQDATPEATPEVTPEATAIVTEGMTTSEIFAQLPQARLEDGGFVVGNPDAPITIIEFADYACPHCQAYRPQIEQVIADYVATGQAKFELRIFPTAGGQLTFFVGQLVECAENQRTGAFWDAYDILYNYATSGKYDQNVGRLLARDLDINYAKMLVCAQDASQVLTDIRFGQVNNVTGTPAIMVRYHDGDPQFITYNDVLYNAGGVAYDVLASVIERANAADAPDNAPMPPAPTEQSTEQVMIQAQPVSEGS